MKRETCSNGFTLLELLVAMALGIIIAAAGFAFYTLQLRSQVTQQRITDMQQNLRAAMVMMAGDIRMAGYDPTGDTGAGFTTATATDLTFSVSLDAESNGLDDDSDGVVDEADEAGVQAIRYRLFDDDGDGDMDLVRDVAGTRVAVAENIEGLEFNYMLESGTFTSIPASLDEVVAVRIALLARTMTEDPSFSNPFQYTGYATTWDAGGDGYHRRILRSTVRCRNRGIYDE